MRNEFTVLSNSKTLDEVLLILSKGIAKQGLGKIVKTQTLLRDRKLWRPMITYVLKYMTLRRRM